MMRSAVLVLATVAASVIGAAGVAAVTKVDDAATVRATAFRVNPGPRPPETSAERASAEVLELVNAERRSRGLPILFWHDAVANAAQGHAADMASTGTLRHQGSDGSSAGDRLTRSGFVWKSWGENIAAGYGSPAAVVKGWMDSPPHRKFMLGDFTFVGIGVATTSGNTPYWDLVVAR